MSNDRQLLTVSETALLLGVSAPTVRRLIRTGELPAIKLGHRRNSAVRVDRRELDAWLYEQPREAA